MEGDDEDVISVPGSEPTYLRDQVKPTCDDANMKYEACLTLCDKCRCCWNSNESSCSSEVDSSTYAACANLAQ